MKGLIKVKDFYNKAEEYLLVGSLAFTVIIVFIQVVMRYVFNSSLSWSEELCRYIFIWQVWLGASLAFRDKQHISIEMVRDKLTGRAKAIYNMIGNIITLAFNIFLVNYGFQLVDKMIQRGVLSSGMRIPLYLVYLSVPLSSLVILFRILGNIYEEIKVFKNYERSESL
ncbi:hypothetical protein GCM10008905_18940 [Clostridium malenominatum]|uniref:Tripartite ATP-independent periplasmic transporters DctQ component domain-containing protein n=1 Tax=Clostridium malenominatum TaxID=1539 RepID=A0ABP3U551_9CLOT